jgi:hypothetical protein
LISISYIHWWWRYKRSVSTTAGDGKTDETVLAAAGCARTWCLREPWAECTALGASTTAGSAQSLRPVPASRQRRDAQISSTHSLRLEVLDILLRLEEPSDVERLPSPHVSVNGPVQRHLESPAIEGPAPSWSGRDDASSVYLPHLLLVCHDPHVARCWCR